MAIVTLLVLVAAQATYHFRDSIVTFWPVTRPAFERFCEAAGCAIRPLRDAAMSHLSIEASDLQADPAHRGLLILTATLRNRATLVARLPAPRIDADRCPGPRGRPPRAGAGRLRRRNRRSAEGHRAERARLPLKIFIDASATTQAGYRLYMFYP